MRNDELKGIWKEAVMSSWRYYPGICAEGPRKIVADIRTENIPNITPRHYLHITLHGMVVIVGKRINIHVVLEKNCV
jgi:hypothetical protein